jgi:hypothetical protein
MTSLRLGGVPGIVSRWTDGRTILKRSFLGRADLCQFLPDGEPVQLTHDQPPLAWQRRMVRSLPWHCRTLGYIEVPVLEAGPSPATQCLVIDMDLWKAATFSEIKEGLHMGIVTTDEAETVAHIYLPPGERA